MLDFSSKTDLQIDQWIKNHEEKGVTSTSLYHGLLEERARRAKANKLLDSEKSLSLLKQAAIEHRCVSYGELAKANNTEWKIARHLMNGKNGHLDRLLDVCHARSLPLLTAICVNQRGLLTGELDKSALSGFAEGARRIGRKVVDELAFHHASRDECWEWGRRQHANARY